ncbi:LPD7 domain-containing protein [Acinetobacter baumannii]|uniref:LPD7 domain-containing protein n=1 Tax=Acinetobacter baumannii TaxID=470 RepID=UPI00233FE2E0|nr:LPD7 domain-containing protein [Acinetobacter baumannii]MDC4147460.1 hypothetical protein [Acinetobacter baumannii]
MVTTTEQNRENNLKDQINNDKEFYQLFSNPELAKAITERLGGKDEFFNTADNKKPNEYVNDFQDSNKIFYMDNKKSFDNVLDAVTQAEQYEHKGYTVLYAADGAVKAMETDLQIKNEADRIKTMLETGNGFDDPKNTYIFDTINKLGYLDVYNEHKAMEAKLDRDIQAFKEVELPANDVLKAAALNYHPTQINELKSLISDIEKEGAIVTGKYDQDNLQLNLTVKDADLNNTLFTLETAKMSSEILLTGKQTNEEFIYTFKEPMDEIERNLIVDQVSIEKREALEISEANREATQEQRIETAQDSLVEHLKNAGYEVYEQEKFADGVYGGDEYKVLVAENAENTYVISSNINEKDELFFEMQSQSFRSDDREKHIISITENEAIQGIDAKLNPQLKDIEIVNNGNIYEQTIQQMEQKYNADLERMGALEAFNNSGSNTASQTYNQLKEIADKNGMEIELSNGSYPDSVKAEFVKDGEITNISAQIHLDGKAAIAYDESIYILSNKPEEINNETSRLINEYETDRSFNYIEYIPEREMVQDDYIPSGNIDTNQYSQDYSHTQESISISEPVAAQDAIPDPNLEAKTPDSVVRNDTPLQDTTSQVETTTINTDRAIESNTRVDTPEVSSSASVEKTGYSIPPSIAADYVHTPADSAFKSSKFYEKNNPLSVAFEDKGKSLSSGRDDAKTIQSMVAIAKQKNWGNIHIKGSEEFKRQAWIEAQAHGIHVKGYSPTERDKVALQVRQEELSRNQIHHAPVQEKQHSKTEVSKSTEVKHETKVNHREDLEAKRIASRRLLEFMIKDRPDAEKKQILGEFDKKANDPKQLEKLVAPVIKHAQEMQHSPSGNKERSR